MNLSHQKTYVIYLFQTYLKTIWKIPIKDVSYAYLKIKRPYARTLGLHVGLSVASLVTL